MNFKVGDKVRVKSLNWYNENKNTSGNIPSIGFIDIMAGFCGHETEIEFTNPDSSYNLVNCAFKWHNLAIEPIEKKQTALDSQISGDHYKKLAIQPVEYVHKNNLNFLQGSIIKYVTRYKDKNGIDDLQKARHCIDLLIEMEYLR